MNGIARRVIGMLVLLASPLFYWLAFNTRFGLKLIWIPVGRGINPLWLEQALMYGIEATMALLLGALCGVALGQFWRVSSLAASFAIGGAALIGVYFWPILIAIDLGTMADLTREFVRVGVVTFGAWVALSYLRFRRRVS